MNNTNAYNWIEDFGINEMLHSGAQELAGAYSRISYNNPTSTEHETWLAKSFQWSTFDRTIKDLVFETKESAEAQIDQIAAELKSVLNLERSLIGDNIEA